MALNTCHGLAAFLTETFHQSLWTDQEIGFCVGRRVPIVSIKLAADPYGFIARYQAVNGRGKSPAQIANEIFSSLVNHQVASVHMAEALVTQFEKSRSYAEAKRNVVLLTKIKAWTPELLRRVQEAVQQNSQVGEAIGVPSQVERIIEQHEGAVARR